MEERNSKHFSILQNDGHDKINKIQNHLLISFNDQIISQRNQDPISLDQNSKFNSVNGYKKTRKQLKEKQPPEYTIQSKEFELRDRNEQFQLNRSYRETRADLDVFELGEKKNRKFENCVEYTRSFFSISGRILFV